LRPSIFFSILVESSVYSTVVCAWDEHSRTLTNTHEHSRTYELSEIRV